MLKNKRSGFAQVAIPLALLLIIGGGVVAWNIYGGSAKSPDEAVNSAFTNFVKAKSFEYGADIVFETKNRSALNGSSLPGVSDFVKGKTGKFTLSIDGLLNSVGKAPVFSALFKLSTEFTSAKDNFSGELEARFIANTLYARFKTDNLDLSGPAAFATAFSDKWIKIDQETASQFSDTSNSENIDVILEQNEKARNIISKAFSEHKVLSASEVGEEDVDGIKAMHYKVSINSEALAAALPEIAKELKAAFPEQLEGEEPTEKELKRMKENIADTDFPEFDLWVGPGMLPYKISFSGVDADANTEYSVEVLFKSFGKNLTVEKPANAQSIEEIFSAMFSGFNPQMFDAPQGSMMPDFEGGGMMRFDN